MMRWLLTALALVLASSWTTVGQTEEFGSGHGRNCPRCHEPCYPTVSKGTEKKSCWKVETKTICIPKVRFPWETRCCEKGCGKEGCVPPKPGRSKCVNVLVKHEYECSKCKYSWDADGDKLGDGKSDKYKGTSDEPADAGPTPADPPPVEASLPLSHRRIAPVGFEQSDSAAPVKQNYFKIPTSLFK